MTAQMRASPRAASEVADVLVDLRHGDQVSRFQIRRMGQIAESINIERGEGEPYDQFLGRMLEELTKERDR